MANADIRDLLCLALILLLMGVLLLLADIINYI